MKRLPAVLRPRVASQSVDIEFKLKQLLFLASVLIASIVVTNVIGTKVMTFLGLNFTAGVITYGIVFLCTDVISEIWGKRVAYYLVLLGFLSNVLMLVFVQLAIWSEPATFWGQQSEYESTLGAVPRIVAASMVAYLVSQIHDVWAFDFWRRVTAGRWLALRNNFSTFTSQLIDTTIFLAIAFLPSLPLKDVVTMLWGQLLIKWAIAACDTPFIYLVVAWLGRPVAGAHSNE